MGLVSSSSSNHNHNYNHHHKLRSLYSNTISNKRGIDADTMLAPVIPEARETPSLLGNSADDFGWPFCEKVPSAFFAGAQGYRGQLAYSRGLPFDSPRQRIFSADPNKI